MTTILALDSSTEACSVALHHDSEFLWRHEITPRQHAGLILPFIDGLLEQSSLSLRDLDAIAFGRGPGSFTGLRICTGIAQGLSYGLTIPLLPVSSLEALAIAAKGKYKTDVVLACIDARIGEVYWAVFDVRGEQCQLIGSEHLSKPQAVTIDTEDLSLSIVGNGTEMLELAQIKAVQPVCHTDGAMMPTALAMLTRAIDDFSLGQTIFPEQAAPVYLRDNVAKKPG